MVCSQCGNLRSECSDPSIDWHPRTGVCWASATRMWAKDLLDKHHSKDEIPEGALHPLLGKWVWVSQIAPPEDEDEFAPLVAASQQADG